MASRKQQSPMRDLSLPHKNKAIGKLRVYTVEPHVCGSDFRSVKLNQNINEINSPESERNNKS